MNTDQNMPTASHSLLHPRVAISILNWNDGQATVRCLRSVSRLNYPNWFVIVIDNHSSDGSAPLIRDQIRSHFGNHASIVEYSIEEACRGGDRNRETGLRDASLALNIFSVDLPENLGFDGGHNVGIQYALLREEPADFVLLLNNDTEVTEDLLDRLVEAASVPGVGIAGSIVLDAQSHRVQFAKSRSLFHHYFFTFRDQDQRRAAEEFWYSDMVLGAAMMIRSDLLESIHKSRGRYLNDRLFAYHDELDLCFVALQLGFKTAVAGKAVVYHGIELRPRLMNRSLLFHYYFTRNAILLARAQLPFHKKALFHALYIPLAFRRATKMAISGKKPAARAILLGLKDGYRGVDGKWKYHDCCE